MAMRMTQPPSSVRINVGRFLNALTFSSNGEYLVSGGTEGVLMWRVEDGKRIGPRMAAPYVRCVAASRDTRWIAAGTYSGELFVWDAKTYQKVLSLEGISEIYGVDFSPDSNRLITAAANGTASIWEIATRGRATLYHDGVLAAKYSPHGDKIATASSNSVRVYDSHDRRLLMDFPIKVTGGVNTGFLWSNEHLFVVSDGKIKQIEAYTGSVVSEWPVPGDNGFGRIGLPTHGGFVAHSTSRTVTFWDASSHTQLGLIQSNQDICSITLSPDDHLLAIGEESGGITIERLSYITEPDIQIDAVALELWKQDQLAQTETSLTATISKSQDISHRVLASRALVRARLQQWDAAIGDAEQSIKMQPSLLGFIAKSVALVGIGKKNEAYRVCDIAFKFSHSTYVSFILLTKAIIVFIAGEHEDAISRVDDLIATLHFNSTCHVVQARAAYMYLARGDSRMANKDYEGAVQSFERARDKISHSSNQPPLLISLISGWKFDDLGVRIQQHFCEALYAASRLNEGGESLLKMVDTFEEEVYMSGFNTKWVSDFAHRCLSIPESEVNTALEASRRRELLALFAAPNSPTPRSLLREWAKATLAGCSWKDALVSTARFVVPRFTICQVLCERLEVINHILDASECLLQMMNEMGRQTNPTDEQAEWLFDFKHRCLAKLGSLADTAMSAGRYDNAICQYSAALSLDPAAPQSLLIKRSKAYMARGWCEKALDDANKVIMLDPSSPWGYEVKHMALHKAGDHENAINVFEMMLSKMSQSPDPEIREHRRRYVDPGETKATIRKAIQVAICESPRVLISTTSGRLCNKLEQAAAFESLPVFTELVSSTTTHIDQARIEQEVTNYYRYATFSHKWEENEPLFDKVLHIVVYDLGQSPTHDKLQMFCKIVRKAGFHWAWSDTCCINRTDHFVLQEAIVSMFKWYQGSALTIIFLRGVRSPSRRGDLVRSIWNTRAWTFQEYHASKVVQFYTEDWKPYLNLDIPNHKDSQEIISEMEEATGVSARALMALRPGFDDIREKLRLASRRQTTLVEDAAYSLLGMFCIPLPVVYGEGDQALGRLLAQLLTSAGDTSILSWTGKSGSFNSCLPANITVFSQLSTSQIPPAINSARMEKITTGLQASPLDFALVMKLYDHLDGLPVAWFVGQRLKLPCIKFKLGPLSSSRSGSGYIFRAETAAIGSVEIKTKEDLSRLSSLYLIHPWIDFLLDRQPVASLVGTTYENTDDRSLAGIPSLDGPHNTTTVAPQTRASKIVSRIGRSLTFTRLGDSVSFQSPSSVSPLDRQLLALRVLARLRQPFGALLLTPDRGNVAAYRRVAAESLITVQIEEITPTILSQLEKGVRILDVL